MNTTPLVSSPPPRKPWWQRLHAALMPDYNAPATAVWWGTVTAGAALLLACLWSLAGTPLAVVWQVAAGMGLATAAGLFPLRLPGTRQSYAAGEILIFLVLLMHGPQAAAVVAAGEAAIAAARTSRRWTSRLFSPASAALSMWATGTLLEAGLAQLRLAGWTDAATFLAAILVFSAAYFFVNAQLLTGVLRIKRAEHAFAPLAVFSDLRWIALAYPGSATVACLLYVTSREHGQAVLMVMLPLLATFFLTLHFYFRDQEAGLARRAEGAPELADRAQAAEAEMRALLASQRRFQSVFTHAAIGMALLDFRGRIVQLNPALAALLALPAEPPPQLRLSELVLPEDRAALERLLGVSEGREFETFDCEVRGRRGDGGLVWLALHCGFFTDPDSGQPCLILQAQDVTARRSAEAGLEHLAYHDPLTGLPNRRRFIECLAGAVTRSQSDAKHQWALMFIDFDRFKQVNDKLGHGAGDELLRQLARRVQEKLRPGDIVARMGGDEFAILVERIEHERDAVVLAERLMEALRRPFEVGGTELTATASIGITFSALAYDSAEDALRDADSAMYKAKDAGKAGYALFDAGLFQSVSERLRLEGELRLAIDRGELALEYQAVFELGGSGRLAGFEALLRWQHPEQGLLAPGRFLPIAEASGQMLALSDFVLHCACRQLRQWQLSDPQLAELTISVNLSAADLADASLVARVGRAIVESGLRPEQLTLELSEDMLMAQIERASGALAGLRRLGARVAVDDFGSGRSSLLQLSRLAIDSLKIDRSLVSELLPGGSDAALVSGLLGLGSSLRKTMVAEGIETASQLQQLSALGCTYGQGFHLSRPLAAQEIDAWLRQRGSILH